MITFQNRRKNHHLSLHQFIARFLSTAKENRIDDLSRLSTLVIRGGSRTILHTFQGYRARTLMNRGGS